MPEKTQAHVDAAVPLHERPVSVLAGVGAARARALEAEGVVSVWDLLHCPPRPAPPPPPWCEEGPLPRLAAVRLRARLVRIGGRFGQAVDCSLARHDGVALTARFFHAGWVRRQLMPNEWYLWEGRTDHSGRLLLHPRFEHLALGQRAPRPPEEGLRMRYRACAGVSERSWAGLAAQALALASACAVDPLGELDAGAYARLLGAAHAPAELEAWESARAALAARELTALAWRLQGLTAGEPRRRADGRRWRCDRALEARARARLPWPLTPGQELAWAAVRVDLAAAAPMSRLLQGDVGAGKTAVAFLACLAVVADGAQAWVLCPTTPLAEQTAALWTRWLAGSRVAVACLTGSATAAARARMLAESAAGAIGILVGTHALLGAEVRAHDLGLLIIDEQQRFGVAQRMAMVAAGRFGGRPDLLLMSATPIPRTLALTLYGDLPITRMSGAPPGRAGVDTVGARIGSAQEVRALLAASARARAFVILARKQGHPQGLDAEAVAAELAASGIEARLCHGDLEDEEKRAAIQDFASGAARVLVATSVVEVGIDIPAASMMVVAEAERFGLSQLHQLRGRVGRGEARGRCVLGYAGEALPDRLAILLVSDDGLAISEADLAERGPGELLGTLQSGGFALRSADLATDLQALQDAHARVRAARARGDSPPPALLALLGEARADPSAG